MNYSPYKAKFPILSHKGRWKKGFKKQMERYKCFDEMNEILIQGQSIWRKS